MKAKTTDNLRSLLTRARLTLKDYDSSSALLVNARNGYEYDEAQAGMTENAQKLEELMKQMISELNVILSEADAIDIHEYYRMHKVRFTE